jgi:TolB-like protein/class 3 adenylate cyclase/Tfp pilus assembly protein PilF
MAADIVGYSRLIEADEAATLATIKSLKAEAIDPVIAAHRGRIVKLMGDGAIVEFASVVDAVAAAVAVQKAVAERQTDTSPDSHIVFRIGINLGDVVVEGDDLLGDGVNVAARLEQLCEPGGILVSGTAFDHMQGKLGLPLDFAGEQQVKNISRPVRTYRVRLQGAKRTFVWDKRRLRRALPTVALALAALVLAAGGAWWFLPTETASGKSSIAVLPFDSIGSDESTGRFADGITEDIITDLARYREVDVIGRNSSAVYKGKPTDIRQIGEDLKVRFALEGSVQQQADQIRITAQLIDARTGAHIWSERWDRPLADLFAVQSDISEQVAGRLLEAGGAITTAEHAANRRENPHNLSAYELFLQGRESQHRFTKEGNEKAIRLLRQAVEKDPTLARAWVELAGAYEVSIEFGANAPDTRAKALEAAQRAVEVDPMDAMGHAQLAFQLGMKGDFNHAKAEWNTALRLNPSSADIMTMYAGWVGSFETYEIGGKLVDRAIRLDPNYPVWAIGPFSFAYVMAERYEEALAILEGHSTDNYTMFSFIFRAASNAMLGKREEATLWVERTLEKHPDLTIEGFLAGPDWMDSDRTHLGKIMRQAGFPLCAKAEQLGQITEPVRLPECVGS